MKITGDWLSIEELSLGFHSGHAEDEDGFMWFFSIGLLIFELSFNFYSE